MKRIRVVIAQMPQLVAEIIGGVLTDEPDLEVIDAAASPDLLGLLDTHRPAAMILGHDEPRPDHLITTLLRHQPSLVLLLITGNGRNGYCCQMVPTCRPVQEISPDSLVLTLRRQVAAVAEIQEIQGVQEMHCA